MSEKETLRDMIAGAALMFVSLVGASRFYLNFNRQLENIVESQRTEKYEENIAVAKHFLPEARNLVFEEGYPEGDFSIINLDSKVEDEYAAFCYKKELDLLEVTYVSKKNFGITYTITKLIYDFNNDGRVDQVITKTQSKTNIGIVTQYPDQIEEGDALIDYQELFSSKIKEMSQMLKLKNASKMRLYRA